MAKGECNCGAVAFEIHKPIQDVIICHCSICRKATGNNGMALVLAMNEDFTWLRGQEHIQYWKKPDADWEGWFCQICGSTLPGRNDDTKLYVPVGLITEGSENLRVAHHIFTHSRAAWDEIGDNGKQHPHAFGSGDRAK